jgi:hypothetical protein
MIKRVSLANSTSPLSAVKEATESAVPKASSAIDDLKMPTKQGAKPSREGKTNITGYFDPAWKTSLRLIQIKTGNTFQASLEEALADLFRKHNVPFPGTKQ